MVTILVNRPQIANRLVLISSAGPVLEFPSTPPQLSFSDPAEFGELGRQGKKALTHRVAYGLRRLGMKQVIASLDYAQDLEGVIAAFTRISGRGAAIRFNGGSGFHQACSWIVEELEVEILQFAPNGKASRAELSWSLKEHVVSKVSIAQIKRPPPPPPAPPKPKPARTHTVVRGDTLWDLARRYLGNGVRWPEIHRLNLDKIRDPHWIYPGQVFRIP